MKMTEYTVRRDEDKKTAMLKESLKAYSKIEHFMIKSSLTLEEFDQFLELSEDYILKNDAYKMYLLIGETD